MSSEYKSTASVFSSCAGSCTFTSARIPGGASLAPAARGAPIAKRASSRATHAQRRPALLACRCRGRLQNDLLFIGCPHNLIKLAKRRVEFRIEIYQIALHVPFDVQRPVIVLDFHGVQHDLGIAVFWLWQAAHLPAKRQFNAYVVHLFRSVMEIHGMHPRGVLTH